MKTIPLANSSSHAIVDDEDFERVSRYRWKLHPYGYVYTRVYRNGKRCMVYLHRFILGDDAGPMTDHVNGIRHDCRRSNLRPATARQNSINRRKRAGTRSRFKGVYWKRDHWEAYIKVHGRMIYLGSGSELEMARRFDDAARRYHGEFARLNAA